MPFCLRMRVAILSFWIERSFKFVFVRLRFRARDLRFVRGKIIVRICLIYFVCLLFLFWMHVTFLCTIRMKSEIIIRSCIHFVSQRNKKAIFNMKKIYIISKLKMNHITYTYYFFFETTAPANNATEFPYYFSSNRKNPSTSVNYYILSVVLTVLFVFR